MHVPKTGGTTLRLLLESQVDTKDLYPFRNIMSAKGKVKENLVSGHFPYLFCKRLDDTFEKAFKITILRDPVERYLSYLRAKKKADVELPDLESVLKLRHLPHSKYYEELVDNAICRYFASESSLEGEALLESAKHTLEQFDCILFFEHYIEDVLDLFKRFDIELAEADVPKINVTQKEAVNAELLEEVRQLNLLDIQLYEYAKNHISKKTTKHTLRNNSFENLLQQASAIDYTFNLPLNGRGWTYREISEDQIVYRWVMDYPASIYFNLKEDSDYILFFNAQTLTEEIVPRVKVNGKEIEIVRLNREVFSLYQGLIPKEYIGKHPIEISFFSTKAVEYRDVYPSNYNRNHPPLSFALNRIQISPKK